MRYISPLFHPRSLHGLIMLGAAAAGLSLSGTAANAQVTTSRNALDALGTPRRPAILPDGGSMSASPSGTTTAGPDNSAGSNTASRGGGDIPGSHAPATAIASPAAIASLPPVATKPPDNPVLRPPELHVPTHPFPMPPEVKADPQARGRAERITGGTRLHFTTQAADMNSRMIAALQTFATVMQKLPDQHISITAYGEGRADDPSTPRRVALSRGLAARSVLLHAGIAPTRIYVRAVGLPDENAHGAGADCIDVTRSGVVASNSTGSPSR
ncbi:hypothetical protein LV478_06905 [Komagataeibacter oboediens]|nr:hypothetical protein [Komagataeibacter oboediens]MBV1824202.1 hypothetical protein [Komagataeibacter oboediens]WEQ53238.1 hypothetical protein LV478_06905 [Komagataeibacter oboediens]GCE81065.1 hypothetical protein MSKU3_2540 [Komagataeibacter oboediens]